MGTPTPSYVAARGCLGFVPPMRHVRDHKQVTSRLKQRFCRSFLCARVDSNHHGENSPQGPQPRTPAPDASARVQIVRSVRLFGHGGRIGRNHLCQRCATPDMSRVCLGRGAPVHSRTRVRASQLFGATSAGTSTLRRKMKHCQPACQSDRSDCRFSAVGQYTYSGEPTVLLEASPGRPGLVPFRRLQSVCSSGSPMMFSWRRSPSSANARSPPATSGCCAARYGCTTSWDHHRVAPAYTAFTILERGPDD
jgi:hypothetical protein